MGANTQHVRDKILKYEATAEVPPKFIIVDLSPVSHVDTSAMHILEDMRANYESRGIQLCLCNPNKIVMDYLRLSGLAQRIGSNHIFVRMHDAVLSCLQELEGETATVDLEGGNKSDDEGLGDLELVETDTIEEDMVGRNEEKKDDLV